MVVRAEMKTSKNKNQWFSSNFLMALLLCAPLTQPQASLGTGQAGNNARIDILDQQASIVGHQHPINENHRG